MILSTGARVSLAGGALATNIVWVVSGAVTCQVGSHLEGVVLGKTGITLQTGTSLNGRALAQANVVLQVVSNSVNISVVHLTEVSTAGYRQSISPVG